MHLKVWIKNEETQLQIALSFGGCDCGADETTDGFGWMAWTCLEWYGRTVVGRREARWWWCCCCSAALAEKIYDTTGPDRVRSFDSLDRSCTFKRYAVFSSQLASSQFKLTRLTDSHSTHDHTMLSGLPRGKATCTFFHRTAAGSKAIRTHTTLNLYSKRNILSSSARLSTLYHNPLQSYLLYISTL
jgi:hypothetical protein